MSNELKPCPFCGGEPTEEVNLVLPYEIELYKIKCENKKCTILPSTTAYKKEDAIKAWNTRKG